METILVVVFQMLLLAIAAIVFWKSVDVVKVHVQKLFLHVAYKLAERTDCCLQGFGAVFTLFGFIPLSTGYNHSGVKHSECLRNAAIGTGYSGCPESNIHAECDSMRKGVALLQRMLPTQILHYVVKHFCVLYVASARSKARGVSESFNPCTECATFAKMIGLEKLIGHNKKMEICSWSQTHCYGNQEVPQLAPRYSL